MPAKIKLLPTEPPSPPPELTEVQERVDRLEDAVAALCDTQSLEERIADRIAQKLTQHEIQLPPLPSLAVSAAPKPEPMKLQATPLPPAPPAPLATFALPSEAPVGQPLSARPMLGFVWAMLPDTSLVRDLAWDARMGWRLVRDPGYVITWSFKTIPLAVLLYVFLLPKLSPYLGWLVPQVSLGIFGMAFDILLIYLAFKVVQREIRRYADFAAKYRR